jgi:uncharacterized protein
VTITTLTKTADGDADLAGYWEGLRNGHFVLPRCGICSRFHWYPKARCPHCGSDRLSWTRVSDEAVVFTWAIALHAFDSAFADDTPYLIVLVEFRDAPGVRLVSNLVTSEPDRVHVGMAVRPIRPVPDPHGAVLVFAPAED